MERMLYMVCLYFFDLYFFLFCSFLKKLFFRRVSIPIGDIFLNDGMQNDKYSKLTIS